MTQCDNTFTLDELNELSSELGDTILTRLQEHQNYWDFVKIQKRITRILQRNGLATSEVFLNRGDYEGLTVEQAFTHIARAYQFADQLG